jgi:hypothetical protein
MKTKLEMMVAYLAGRQGASAELIRRDLEDPSSEASLWLSELRSRSRALFNLRSRQQPDRIGSRSIQLDLETTIPRISRRWPLLYFLGASAATLLLCAVGMEWRARNDRLLHLEAIIAEQNARWGDRLGMIELAVTTRQAPDQTETPTRKIPISPNDRSSSQTEMPTTLALARLEAKLGELGQQLSQDQPKQDAASPSIEPLRGDLERLRREVENSSHASKQQIQELSAVVREVLHLLRRLTGHGRMPEPLQVPAPVSVPVPQKHDPALGQNPKMSSGPGQPAGEFPMPGQEPGHQQRGLLHHPGGHIGAGMQTPGGPR